MSYYIITVSLYPGIAHPPYFGISASISSPYKNYKFLLLSDKSFREIKRKG
jgi:hypothetical protein